MRDLTITTENWQARANCRDTDPDVMQPEVASDEDVAEAKRLCVGCPVWDQCKALAESQLTGAYGVHAGKWYGHKPAPVVCCTWCGSPLMALTSRRSYCNDTCRKRASRSAAAALALSA